MAYFSKHSFRSWHTRQWLAKRPPEVVYSDRILVRRATPRMYQSLSIFVLA